MQGLIYEGKRCPDGVELTEARSEGPLDLGLGSEPERERWFRYRTEQRAPVRLEIRNLEDPIVCRFINALTDSDLQAFFARYGLPERDDEWPHLRVVNAQVGLKRLLAVAAGSDPREAVRALNDILTRPAEFDDGLVRRLSPILTLTPSGVPETSLLVSTLHSLMLMECVMAAELGARFAACEHCGSVFLTGPLTARRSHARFCSDRCRVAAMRARSGRKEG